MKLGFVTYNIAKDWDVPTIIAKCREMLADFKVPQEVHLVDDFPRALLNKISKKDLRRQFLKDHK